jgi:hypothetical protein
MTVADAAADLGRARHLGWRLPCAPAVPDSLASAEELRLGSRDPLHATPRELPAGLPLTRAGMCLLLAGLAPEPHPSESRAGRD